MRAGERASAAVYLLILVAGVVIGLLAGGELIRHLYAPSARAPASTPADTLNAASTSPVQRAVDDTRETAIVRATKSVSSCVVGIVVTQIQVVQSRYYFNDFFDLFMPRLQQVENMGSGVVIRDDGMILTNYHVVDGARAVYVNFPDGRQMEGTVVGVDEQSDLAVLTVKSQNLPTIKMGDSGKLMIGEWVLAIGNPFLNFINDAHPTVTVGVVSALDRNFSAPEGAQYRGMIQTDAAINPGNSGGPLVDALGRAIGINTVIYTGSDAGKGWIGIGFAIPINRAKRVADELIKFGRRRPVWAGIQAQDLTREVALALGYDRTDGVVVVGVQQAGPGELAGLRRGDILRSFGTTRIRSMADFEAAFLDVYVGDRVKVGYRRGGAEQSATIAITEYPRNR